MGLWRRCLGFCFYELFTRRRDEAGDATLFSRKVNRGDNLVIWWCVNNESEISLHTRIKTFISFCTARWTKKARLYIHVKIKCIFDSWYFSGPRDQQCSFNDSRILPFSSRFLPWYSIQRSQFTKQRVHGIVLKNIITFIISFLLCKIELAKLFTFQISQNL